MSRSGRDDEPYLFDLPLTPEGREEGGEEPRRSRSEGREDEPDSAAARGADPDATLFPPDTLLDDPFADPEADRPPPHRPQAQAATATGDPIGWDVVDRDGEPVAPAATGSAAATSVAPRHPGVLPRLAAAGVDALSLATVAGLALVGAILLGARPGIAVLPGLGLLLVVFSFAYSVVPLAFWGATPGMAAAHLVARDRDGGPLTFGQTAVRWLAGLLTLLLAGLPMLLALEPLGARSPADRLSRSLTWQRR